MMFALRTHGARRAGGPAPGSARMWCLAHATRIASNMPASGSPGQAPRVPRPPRGRVRRIGPIAVLHEPSAHREGAAPGPSWRYSPRAAGAELARRPPGWTRSADQCACLPELRGFGRGFLPHRRATLTNSAVSRCGSCPSQSPGRRFSVAPQRRPTSLLMPSGERLPVRHAPYSGFCSITARSGINSFKNSGY